MKKAIFPGSFDPFHEGHKSIYDKALKLFDEVIIYITFNEKKNTQKSLEDREAQILTVVPNAKIIMGKELTVKVAKENNATFLVRGVRNEKDFLYEHDLASYNKALDETIETVFLLADENFKHISSTEINKILKKA